MRCNHIRDIQHASNQDPDSVHLKIHSQLSIPRNNHSRTMLNQKIQITSHIDRRLDMINLIKKEKKSSKI